MNLDAAQALGLGRLRQPGHSTDHTGMPCGSPGLPDLSVGGPSLASTHRTTVNDMHSALNATVVGGTIVVESVPVLQHVVRSAAAADLRISIAGGRHAMGGQQFGTGTILLDMRRLSRVLEMDSERGLVVVEAGIDWPRLVNHLLWVGAGQPHQWGIIQKQTGADRLTIGGALAANIHGRGLRLRPFIGDVESFDLVDHTGTLVTCNRSCNPELFALAIGGYGLFGVIARVTLRLVRRHKLERRVTMVAVENLPELFERRIADGFEYGDCQFATDPGSGEFLRAGVFSCYRPVANDTPLAAGQKELSDADWAALLNLAHTDGSKAFERYVGYYLTTTGQVYWSDTHQLSTYLNDYHRALDLRLGGPRATEMITEIYVPRPALAGFFGDVREAFRANGVPIVYGTVRLIDEDTETFLPWARESWACTIFNLHVEHTPAGIERSADAFRALIDMALRRNGSYFLTYHRHARREQVEAAYPKFASFLEQKRKYDPDERFQSEWWRHYRRMFGERAAIA